MCALTGTTPTLSFILPNASARAAAFLLHISVPYFEAGKAFTLDTTVLPPNGIVGAQIFQGTTTVDIAVSVSVFMANGAGAQNNPTGLMTQISQINSGVASTVNPDAGVELVLVFQRSPNSFEVSPSNSQTLLNLVAQIAALLSLCMSGATIVLKAIDFFAKKDSGKRFMAWCSETAKRCAGCCGMVHTGQVKSVEPTSANETPLSQQNPSPIIVQSPASVPAAAAATATGTDSASSAGSVGLHVKIIDTDEHATGGGVEMTSSATAARSSS